MTSGQAVVKLTSVLLLDHWSVSLLLDHWSVWPLLDHWLVLPSLDHWSVWSSLDYWSVWPLLDYWLVWPLVSLIIVWPLVSLAIVWNWSVWPLLDTGQFDHCLTLVSLAIAWHWSTWPLLDTGQFDHCLTTGQFSHCLTTGLFREPTHNSHWHRFGPIETWAQRDVGTKRRGHKIPLFWAQRDVGTKYHFPGHIETWAQRDVGTKRCFTVVDRIRELSEFTTRATVYWAKRHYTIKLFTTQQDSIAIVKFCQSLRLEHEGSTTFQASLWKERASRLHPGPVPLRPLRGS